MMSAHRNPCVETRDVIETRVFIRALRFNAGVPAEKPAEAGTPAAARNSGPFVELVSRRNPLMVY